MPKLKSKLRGGRQAKFAVVAAAAASLGVASFAAISPAHADTTDVLLEQLKAKGILTKKEYAKLKARHAVEKREHYHYAGPPGGMIIKGPAPEYVTVCPTHICMRVGQVDVSIAGYLVFGGVESFKAYGGPNPIGGLVTDTPTMSHNAFSAGLLPSAISVSLATHQMGYDLGFTIAAFTGGNNVTWVGGANSPGNPFALGTPGIDLRQIFGTVGTPTVGTFKIGRDLGLFAADAILNDATLLGMGSPLVTSAPHDTTLGRIGLGYVYADWIPGVVYTTPDFNGFTASFGVYTPLDSASTVTGLGGTGNFAGHEEPMLQGQLKWKGNIAPGAKLLVSANGVWEHQRNDPATGLAGTVYPITLAPGANADSWGVDGFGKLDAYGFSLVAYGYYGEGLGTTGLFLNGFDALGNRRKSYGGYGQASYTWDKFTVGGSWGISGLNATAVDCALGLCGVGGLVHYNESAIGFLRYQLTSWMALQTEYVHTWSYAQVGPSAQIDAIWFGTFWAF